MSLVPGEVTFDTFGDADGGHGFKALGTGFARAIYDAEISTTTFTDVGAIQASFQPELSAAVAQSIAPDSETDPVKRAQNADSLAAQKKLFADRAAKLTAQQIANALKNNLELAKSIGRRANAVASATVAYFTANAEVGLSGVVATIPAHASLGTLPSPLVTGTPITGPLLDVPLVVSALATVRIS